MFYVIICDGANDYARTRNGAISFAQERYGASRWQTPAADLMTASSFDDQLIVIQQVEFIEELGGDSPNSTATGRAL